MKRLTEDEYGVFADMNGVARVDSRLVAKVLDKSHREVLRDIEKITSPDFGFGEEFCRHNFAPFYYRDSQNAKRKAYAVARDGFFALLRCYSGSKDTLVRRFYISRFNRMDDIIRTLMPVWDEFPILTESIRLIFENPRPNHYLNECDMISRLALGMGINRFREVHDIPEDESIRPYLSDTQVRMLDLLETADTGLLLSVPSYADRKKILKAYRGVVEEDC